VHFGLAAEPGNALAKSTPVDPDRLAEGVIALENGSELKGKDGGVAKAVTNYTSMFDRGFLIEFTGCVVIFAHNDSEFTTWIAQNRCAVNSLYTFEKERAASAGSIWEGLMLGKTIRVPRHVELSEPG